VSTRSQSITPRACPTITTFEVTPSQENLPDFARAVHRDVSCGLHDLLVQERYDAPRELFDDRPAHMMRLLDAGAQASHLVYTDLNAVAAGLVQRPEHMPGRTLDFGLWKTGYIEVERPPVYFSKDRPAVLRLELTPPPLLYEAFDGDLDRLVYQMTRLSEEGLRALRAVQRRPPMGARALERLHPWSEPRTLRESRAERVPAFQLGARGLAGRQERIEGALEVRGYRQDHREVRLARRAGDLERRFPFGTYAMRVYHGAPVEPEPALEARVTRPGPLLSDVEAALAQRRHDRVALRAASEALCEEVREAWREEAADIVEETELDLATAQPLAVRTRLAAGAEHESGRMDEPATDEGARAPAVVRHRFDPRRNDEVLRAARRLIVLRDRRRGRPARRGEKKHGSDPPD